MRDPGMRALMGMDLNFVVGLTARNAFTLLSRPSRIFDAEQCYPAQNTLALGEPMLTQGLVGVPAYLLTGDPVATFNLVLLAITLLSAFAMYWLIRGWTGVPAAGIIAGLLYAFHKIKMGDVVHYYAWDSVWTVLAFLFGTRLFARGHWLDAIALALCCSLQIGGSFYPLLSAIILAIPFGMWLVLHYGVRNVRIVQWVVVVGTICLVAFVVFGPYLELRDAGALKSREYQAYFAYSWLLPGQSFFPGWGLLALALAGLTLGRKRTLGRLSGDPRWALLAGSLLTLVIAAGGTDGEIMRAIARGEQAPPHLPNLYRVLKSTIPGLDVVRAPAALFSGTHLTLSMLAGLGSAAVMRLAPRKYIAAVAVALILITYVDTLRPRLVGLRPAVAYTAVPMRPGPEVIGFFEELDRLGNSGPILEVPNQPKDSWARSSSALLTAYHHRYTSRCYNSFLGLATNDVMKLGERLPEEEAILALSELGFTTIVLHHPPPEGRYTRRLRQKLERFAAGVGGEFLTRLYGNSSMTAYGIVEVEAQGVAKRDDRND